MSKYYKAFITSIDRDTGVESFEEELTLENMFLMGDRANSESGFSTLILNTSIMNIAAMLASSEKAVYAVRLANVLLEMKNKEESCETELLNAIMGGK